MIYLRLSTGKTPWEYPGWKWAVSEKSGGTSESEYETFYIAEMADEYKTVLTGGLSLKGGLFKSKKK